MLFFLLCVHYCTYMSLQGNEKKVFMENCLYGAGTPAR